MPCSKQDPLGNIVLSHPVDEDDEALLQLWEDLKLRSEHPLAGAVCFSLKKKKLNTFICLIYFY